MTWLVILGLAATLGAMLLRGRWRERGEVAAIAAAIAAGLSGYALTGYPALKAHPAQRVGDDRGFTGAYGSARAELLAAMGETGAWLIYADALTRDGNTSAAIRGIERGLGDHPRSADLWIGLGQALTDHSRRMTPAARLAFARAVALDPVRGRYFLGLARLETGDPAGALAVWDRIATPPPRLAADRVRACAMLGGCGSTTPSTSPGGYAIATP